MIIEEANTPKKNIPQPPNSKTDSFDSIPIIICPTCQKTINGTAYYFKCNHLLCHFCLSYHLIRHSLSYIDIDDKEIAELHCPCGKGKLKISYDNLNNFLIANQSKPPKCKEHNNICTTYCNECRLWLCTDCLSLFHTKYFPKHQLSTVPNLRNTPIRCTIHNKKIKIKCMTCNDELCMDCLVKHTNHFIIYYKDLIREHMKFPEYNQYINYLLKREMVVKDNLYIEKESLITKIDRIISDLNYAKIRYNANYEANLKYVTSLFDYAKNLYYFLYEKVSSNDITINPLLCLPREDSAFIDISLMQYININIDNLVTIAKEALKTPKNCKINLVQLIYVLIKSTMTQGRKKINAVCQIDKSIVALATDSMTIELIDLNDYDNQYQLEAHGDNVTALVSRHFGDLISCSLDCRIKIWLIDSIETAQLGREFTGHKDGINTIILINNYQYLVSGAKDNNIKIWDLQSLKYIRTLSKHKKEVTCLIYFNKNKIASTSLDLTLILWDTDKGTCDRIIELTRGRIYSMFLFDHALYTSMEKDNALVRWNLSSFSMDTAIKKHDGIVTQFSYLSPNLFATSSIDQTVLVWEIRKMHCNTSLIGHKAAIQCVIQLSDKKLISCSDDGVMNVWEKLISPLIEKHHLSYHLYPIPSSLIP